MLLSSQRALNVGVLCSDGFSMAYKVVICMQRIWDGESPFGDVHTQAKEQYACALKLEPNNSTWQAEAEAAAFIERHIIEGPKHFCVSLQAGFIK
jgi:tetratricopeptide (TPR) repeat protein